MRFTRLQRRIVRRRPKPVQNALRLSNRGGTVCLGTLQQGFARIGGTNFAESSLRFGGRPAATSMKA